jgi:peptide methionine sulfoxide reductase msrA/msrB
MKIILIYLSIVVFTLNLSAKELQTLNLNPLSKEESKVIVEKDTERPFSGKYYKYQEDGTYLCKRCNAPLYNSNDKFDSSCGWPSFDDAIPGAVKRVPDADGRRVEIVCANCGAHLGHVFEGEGFTNKNTRYCVNSISLNFEKEAAAKSKKAYFAGGCFWGMEYHFEKVDGVLAVDSGYIGGKIKNPSYKDVSKGTSGHFEAIEVSYDPTKVSYGTLAKLFFEIHDPTQKDGQGPDIGSQYLSAVFTSDKNEKETINKLIMQLKSKGLDISTKILDADTFYKAENYHQDYYKKSAKVPYCHAYVKRF